MAYTATNSNSNINTVTLAETMTADLERALSQKSVTGILSDNGLQPKFMGNGIVIVPELDMSAMGDYDRDTGFVQGAVTISRTPYQLSQDRGRSFQLDAQDADESGIGNLAGEVMAEFVRAQVIPEMDAYVISKIVGAAAAEDGQVEVLDGALPADTVFSKMAAAMIAAQDASDYEEELVCFVDSTIYAALQSTNEISRQLSVIDFTRGEVTTKVQAYNGMPIIPVSSPRMKTAYEFYDGTSEGQKNGGFVPAAGAKNIGFLILPKKAASLVKKTEKVRIFDPSKNIDVDAWKMDYRLYYDVFVRNPYKNTIRALTYTA
ncbi:MAG: hypothetical protein E7549_01970 [Ruminococcaceae bacterium]|nr:hypothetical protein [Oscillospiraceae bacterium]